MGYRELEINTIGRGGKVEPFTFNLDNINYYRSFIEKSDEVGKKGNLSTIVYLKGSPKGMIVKCSYDSFKRQIQELLKNT